jgi:hypothetical protein
MRTRHKQQGISLLSWLAILIVVGFFGLFANATVPAYFSYYTMVQVAESVQSDPSLSGATIQEVRSKLNTRMRINDVDNAAEAGYNAIRIKPAGQGGYALTVDYEVRKPFIGNIDLVMSFERRVGP